MFKFHHHPLLELNSKGLFCESETTMFLKEKNDVKQNSSNYGNEAIISHILLRPNHVCYLRLIILMRQLKYNLNYHNIFFDDLIESLLLYDLMESSAMDYIPLCTTERNNTKLVPKSSVCNKTALHATYI